MKKSNLSNQTTTGGVGVVQATGACTPAPSGLVLNHIKGNNAQLKAQIREKKNKSLTNIIRSYKRKLIIYGNTYEMIEYNKIKYDYTTQRKDYSKNPNGERQRDSLWRTRNTCVRLITANVDDNPLYKPVFVTLTFKDNVQNIRTANRHFKYYTRKLADHIGYRTKYLTVLEFQKRGAIHYHIVYFNLPFIDKHKLESLWNKGMTNIRVVQNLQDVSKYVGKYMNKQLLDKRLVGEKAYFTSRGLVRPVTIYSDWHIDLKLQNVSMELQEVINHPDYKIKKYRI